MQDRPEMPDQNIRGCDDNALQGNLDRLRGSRILIVEDEYLIARNLSRNFEKVGARVLGPVSSIAQAIPHLGKADATVLDINLDGTPVFPLADILHQNHTPFVFFSGCAEIIIPDRFRFVSTLPKPNGIREIIASLVSTYDRPETDRAQEDGEDIVALVPSLRLAARLLITDDAAADRLVERTLEHAITHVEEKPADASRLEWLLSMLDEMRLKDGRSVLN
ncbi:UNVERIFIED_ORG: CheY-like chemotaxis protein [Martelella mediterranea]